MTRHLVLLACVAAAIAIGALAAVAMPRGAATSAQGLAAVSAGCPMHSSTDAQPTSCCGGGGRQHRDHSTAKSGSKPVGNAKNADGKYVCPVMGNPIGDTSTAPSTEYKGKVYYFCCGGCPDKFNANPGKYVPTS